MGRQKLLILALGWPEPKATAAGLRMMQLIRCFKQADWDLTFAATASRGDKAADLEVLGIPFQPIHVNDDAFDSFIEALCPDVVLFDRYITEEQFGWRVAEKTPNALRILDTEDLHSLRIARQLAIKKEKPFDLSDWITLEQTKRELASIYRCDLSLIISRQELKLLEAALKVPSELLLYLPLWTEGEFLDPSDFPSYNSRDGFIFIGNGKHDPNIDAIRNLKNVIWPMIRARMPEAQLKIYGAYLPESVNNLHSPEYGLHIMGYVEDANGVMQQSRVNLAPLRFGAGLKGKLLLAMQNGTPSITTAIGAEGIFVSKGPSKFILDKPEEFAEEAVQVYTSESRWGQLQQLGFDIMKREFAGQDNQQLILSTIDRVMGQLAVHRSRNFIGAMLQHHSLQSTKYLSRWISCKNKLKSLQQSS